MKAITILTFFIFSFLSGVGQITKDLPVGLNVGQEAPNIEMENPDGKVISLNSLRGKIVLIDFWASWCGPCRRENPSLVQVYNKYNSAKFKTAKGFEIYSVSLDSSKEAWENAIEQDGLTWKNHVSDLKKWRSEAGNLYQISSIPSNVLIDENGIILAKNLRGAQLHMKMDDLVKKL